jgi:YVTN family beta-propeller protein
MTNKIYASIRTFSPPTEPPLYNATLAVIDANRNYTVVGKIHVTGYVIHTVVNPNNNVIYVDSQHFMRDGTCYNTIEAINGMTYAHLSTVRLPVTTSSCWSDISVNPRTNMLYIANRDNNTVTAIDGSNKSKSITVPSNPYAIAVNQYTNTVYVANYDSDRISVIDGKKMSWQAHQ